MSQFGLERVTLYSLNLDFSFFTVDRQDHHFTVETVFQFLVLTLS